MPAAILDVGHAQKPFAGEMEEAHGLLHGRNCRKQSVFMDIGAGTAVEKGCVRVHAALLS
jgi:hypothetical protein